MLNVVCFFLFFYKTHISPICPNSRKTPVTPFFNSIRTSIYKGSIKILLSLKIRQSLNDVYRAAVQGKFLYAASAWFGFCITGDKMRLNSFLRRRWKLGYSDKNVTFEDMCAEADNIAFNRRLMIQSKSRTP